ncbi:MAG: 30S ribosomal protein S21 [Candidatus Phytoplasma stylosanthis]|uniref:30S ribosomal protein S21 n=1 Tax=Candidatus Phytoplasma stylosanthis TaxID=2798314 RepID=UPI0029395DD2|nr:30S ribosomal protein S21 [Candidatus Phytoplasma stylosanthis]MDV3167958.1 30S ribosomal protein S21 [Candidatus Phytoplasma stylosanthis]MDV3171050.1 30S ribosomal protein S21 [Candidatus Phytoplasma stylosanthis]MDV3173661.1 30S ribosomal protein S21 [Candidatus Phytoplasma stylosanthis]MDV3174228.1 30S ribosomal protein S21 [Candidatus Phytoplasma stylosanthis]MDV3202715.1 30S ribosomal protein S21 [Candidatus Phytoplasma stylosanthis]
MTKTIVKKEENFDETLRRFKRDVSKSGNLMKARKKEYYVKPSTERKNRKKFAKNKKY